jgi:hypothetical protein
MSFVQWPNIWSEKKPSHPLCAERRGAQRIEIMFGSKILRDRCRAVEPRQVSPGGVPLSPHPRRDFVADDWEDMTVDDKLDHLLSRLDTLEGRLEEVLRHLSELGDAVEAIELKLRQ